MTATPLTADLLLMRARYALNTHFVAQVNAQLAALAAPRPDVEQALDRLDVILTNGGPLVSATVGVPTSCSAGWLMGVRLEWPGDRMALFPTFASEADALAYRDGVNARLDSEI